MKLTKNIPLILGKALLLLVFVVSASNSLAQESDNLSSDEVFDEGALFLSATNIKETSEYITLQINIDNESTESYEDLRYGFTLLRENGVETIHLDQAVSNERISIEAGESLTIEETYLIPAFISGTSTLTLGLFNRSGSMISGAIVAYLDSSPALNEFDEVDAPVKADYIEILSETCVLENDPGNFIPPLVEPETQVNINCQAFASITEPLTITPFTRVAKNHINGDLVYIEQEEQVPFEVSPQEIFTIDFTFTAPSPTQIYVARLLVESDSLVSNSAYVSFRTTGPTSGIINTMSFDERSYVANERISLNVDWFNTSLDELSSSSSGILAEVIMENEDLVCAEFEVVELEAGVSNFTTSGTMTADCDSYTITAYLIDRDSQSVLDTYEKVYMKAVTEGDGAPVQNSDQSSERLMYIIISALILMILVIIVMQFNRREDIEVESEDVTPDENKLN